MKKTLHESRYFRLVQDHARQNPKKKFYRIIWHNWRLPTEYEEPMRDIVDPGRNRSGQHGVQWKFRDRTTAEQLYNILILKFS